MKTLRQELMERYGLLKQDRSIFHWLFFAKYTGLRGYYFRDVWTFAAGCVVLVGVIMVIYGIYQGATGVPQ